MKKDTTYEEVVRIFNYDPQTGSITHKINRGGYAKPGLPAGCKNGRQISINKRLYVISRVIWLMQTGKWPEKCIDHINGNPLDNRWINLREVSHMENMRNKAIRRDGTSGALGVYKFSRRWIVRIMNNDGVREFKTFITRNEALMHAYWRRLELGYHPNHGRKAQT